MFKSLVINGNAQPKGTEVDFGAIVEALIFYQKVRIFLNQSGLHFLVQKIGIDEVLELTKLPNVEFKLYRDAPVVISNGDCYSYGVVGKAKGENQEYEPEDFIKEILIKASEKSGKSRRVSKKYVEAIPQSSILSEFQLCDAARENIVISGFAENAVRIMFKTLVPSYQLPSDFYFNVTMHPTLGMIGDTNLNFNQINEIYHKDVPVSHSTITKAYLFSFIQDALFDLFSAAKHSSEIATNPISMGIIGLKQNEITRKSLNKQGQLEVFQEYVVGNGKAIREAVNSSTKSIDEIVSIVNEAEKFREWLSKAQEDDKLLKEYVEAISTTSWLDKLPSKSVRFGLFTTAGLLAEALIPISGLGTVAGISLSASDAFLLDKLIGGWKPSQFINSSLKTFINKQ